jgi:glucosylglycerate synthase
MATTATSPNVAGSTTEANGLLISLASLARESYDRMLGNITQAFDGRRVVVATPDAASETSKGTATIIGYTPAAPSPGGWTLVAADFLNAHELAQKHQATAVLMLGSEAQSLEPAALRRLADAVTEHKADLSAPRYALPPRAGLVNSAILYPISRALFGAAPRFPLALDLGLSARMAARMATLAQKFTAANQPDALVWPVSEAAVAGFAIVQVEAGPRALPQPAGEDLNSLLALVAGSLFADVDAKAAFWQRSRMAQTTRGNEATRTQAAGADEVAPMVDAFRLAYGNLQEIWSLVLPPQSLLGLKRLSVMPADAFLMSDSLWARIVYDFVLAFRLRTINRGHLLGALTPLYLAWVASHIRLTSAGTDPERHIDALAAAFETDKPYLVSRWRWPDRFNP